MADAKDNSKIVEGPPRVCVSKRPGAWLLFFAVVVALLAGDLWLKSWSFATITPTPLIVTVGEDGPLVYRPGNDGEPERVLLERTHPDHPASAVPNDSRNVIPGVLDLHLTLNTGAVFGIGQGQRWLFIVVSVLATGIILLLVWRSPADARLYHVALGMILSGALGNLYDRMRFAAVRDMLHLFPTTEWYPWIFNLADVALVVGVCIVLLLSFLDARAEKKAALAATRA